MVGLAPRSAEADGAIGVLVLKEHGVGSAAQAQPYVDKFIGLAAKHSGWGEAKGQYHTSRSSAETYIQSQKPQFGILSLAAFLALKSKHNLEVVGQVGASRAGGLQYHLVSKTESDLAGCKGKSLATDHADDIKFIDNVVSGGKFKVADFTLVTTQRPLQTIKKVSSGAAACALIDDAQLAELSHLEGAEGVKSVWKSEKLPPMAVVAFPTASAAQRKAFQASLGKICGDEGKSTCAEVGIQALKSASASDYAAVTAAYTK
jgi:hypothetical protein